MTKEDIFLQQRAQIFGGKSKTVQFLIEKNQSAAKVESWDLDSEVVIGLVCKLPKTAGRLSETAATLLTENEVSHGVLKLSNLNKDVFQIPLRLLQTEGKSFNYIPITPIRGLNKGQSEIVFPTVLGIEGNIEIYFVTAV